MIVKTCGATRPSAVDDGDELICDSSQDHTKPTTKLPQGSAHQDSSQVDPLSGEPWRWW